MIYTYARKFREGVIKLNETIKISLAAARVNAGLTQEDVVKRLKITKNTLVAWEKGLSEPKISQARELSDLYNMPLDHIFFANKIK